MPILNNMLAGASGAEASYEISKSLRLERGDSAYLNKTPSSAGSSTRFTLSFWYKPVINANRKYILTARDSSSNHAVINFQANDVFEIYYWDHGNSTLAFQLISSAFFRDPSAWYHFVVAYDTTQSTTANRIKVYVNGTQLTDFSTANYPSPDYSAAIWNSANAHYIGQENTAYSSFYIADYHWIDGLALPATDFGETDDNGVWQAKKFTGSHNAAAVGTVYSGMLTASTGFSSPATNAFNGNTADNASANLSTDNYIEFTPTTPISFTNGVHVNCYAANGYSITNYYSVDLDGNGLGSETSFVGGGANFNGQAWIQVATGSGTLHKVRIRLTRSGSNSAATIAAIGINGTASSNILLDGTTAGVNGFHLDFSDNSSNSALGTDSSGNNNNWTVNNLNHGPLTKTFVDEKPDGNSWTNSSNAFDGSTSTYADGTYNNGTTSKLTFNPPLTGVTKLRVYWGGTSGVSYNNGSTTTGPGSGSPGYVSLYDSSTPISVYNIGGTNAAGDGVVRLYAVEVNDSLLTGYTRLDPSDIDSLEDSPTNNYCTWNAVNNNLTLSNGNLEAVSTANTWRSATGTIAMTSGKWYWEVKATSVLHNVIGIARSSASNPAASAQEGWDASPDGYLYYKTGQKYNNASATSYGDSYTTDDVIGVAWDADAGNLVFYKNGVSQGTAWSGLTGGPFVPAVSLYSTTSSVSANFGQRPFAFDLPTDHKALNTANLPDPTIKDGSKHFDVRTYSGNGSRLEIGGDVYSTSYTATAGTLADAYKAFSGSTDYANFTANSTSAGATVDFNFPSPLTGVTRVEVYFDSPSGSGDTRGRFNGANGGNTRTSTSAGYSDIYNGSAISLTSVGVGINQNSTTGTNNEIFSKFRVTTSSGTYVLTDGQGDPLAFSPDFLWLKSRNSSYDNWLFDSVRGLTKAMYSNGLSPQYDYSPNGVSATTSTSFTLNGSQQFNTNTEPYVAWAWDGGDLVTDSTYNQSQTWSNATLSNGSNLAGLFDGDNSTNCQQSTNGTAASISNFGPITVASTVSFYSPDGEARYTLNGGSEVSVTGSGWHDISFSGDLTSFTFQGPGSARIFIYGMKADNKELVDAGVMTVGSLNSSAYNQSQTWSSGGGTGLYSGSNWTGTFDGTPATTGSDVAQSAYVSNNGSSTLSFSSSISGVLMATACQGSSNASTGNDRPTITLSDGTVERVSAAVNSPGEIDFGSVSNISSLTIAGTSAQGMNLIKLTLDGKLLVDSGVSLVNVPSITSTVRANPSAGFSICTYSGSGSNGSFGHNLNAVPELVIVKCHSHSQNWAVQHSAYGPTKYTYLNSTNEAKTTGASAFWNDTAPTSLTVAVGTDNDTNASGKTYVAYCFTPVEGYSAMGTFEGTNTSDGPFVWTGFRPAVVIGKNIDASENWWINDSKRDGYNFDNPRLYPNGSWNEAGDQNIELLSNGFKLRNSHTNTSNTYMWIAFAEHPFKYSRAR